MITDTHIHTYTHKTNTYIRSGCAFPRWPHREGYVWIHKKWPNKLRRYANHTYIHTYTHKHMEQCALIPAGLNDRYGDMIIIHKHTHTHTNEAYPRASAEAHHLRVGGALFRAHRPREQTHQMFQSIHSQNTSKNERKRAHNILIKFDINYFIAFAVQRPSGEGGK